MFREAKSNYSGELSGTARMCSLFISINNVISQNDKDEANHMGLDAAKGKLIQ
jgi:hypothetical protein